MDCQDCSTTNDNCGCGASKYWTGTVCADCHSDCQTCSGISASDCLLCSDSNKVNGAYPAKGSCSSCASNQFKINAKTCETCHSDCLTCDNGTAASDCLTCVAGKYNAAFPAKGTCSGCDGSCLTCSGPAANQCLSCAAGKYLDGSN